MTSGGSIRESLQAGGSDPSLPDLKTEPDLGLDKGNGDLVDGEGDLEHEQGSLDHG